MEAFYTELGDLGAQLVGAEFAAQPLPPDRMEALLRMARALHAGARERMETALISTAAEEETLERQLVVKDTPCIGPCTFLWTGANRDKDVQKVLDKMRDTTSSQDASTLYCELMQLQPSGAKKVQRYQLCQLTGFPCSLFEDVGVRSCAVSTAILHMQECVNESALLVKYAEYLTSSRMLQLEAEAQAASTTGVEQVGNIMSAGERHAKVIDTCTTALRGGDKKTVTPVDVITSFYHDMPDFRGKGLQEALRSFNAASTADDDVDANTLDFFVTGAVVEPLVRQVTPTLRDNMRALFHARWLKHVEQCNLNFA